MATIQATIDELRELSKGMSYEEHMDLRQSLRSAKMFGEIFGVFGVYNDAEEKENREKRWKEAVHRIEFSRRAKQFETRFPNAVTPKQRENAREILKELALNPHEYFAAAEEPMETEKSHMEYSAHSWNSVISSVTDEEGIHSVSPINVPSFTTDAAFANSTQGESEVTLIDESSTPVSDYDLNLDTPLSTCHW